MSQWADDPFPFDQEHCLYVERLPIEGNPHVKAGFGVVHNVDEFKEAFSRATGVDVVAAKVHGVGDPSGKIFAFVRLPNHQIRDRLLLVGSFALDFLVGQPWKLVVKAPRGTASTVKPSSPQRLSLLACFMCQDDMMPQFNHPVTCDSCGEHCDGEVVIGLGCRPCNFDLCPVCVVSAVGQMASPSNSLPSSKRTFPLSDLVGLAKGKPQTPHFAYSWEFKTDKQQWYRMRGGDQIEQAYQRGDASLSLAPYEIDLKGMKQKNSTTGTEREIRRVERPVTVDGALPNAKPVPLWEFEDSPAKWKTSGDAATLESAWEQKVTTPVDIGSNRVVDFTTMLQKRTDTSTVRRIRRREFLPRPLTWRDPTPDGNPALKDALSAICGASVSEALVIPERPAVRLAAEALVKSYSCAAWHSVVVDHCHRGEPAFIVFAKCDDDIPKCSNGHRLEFRPTKENPDKVCCCEGTCTHASGVNDATKSKELQDHFTRENSLISAALVACGLFPFLSVVLDSKPSPIDGRVSAETLATACVWILTHVKACSGSAGSFLTVYGGAIRDLLLCGTHPTDIDVASSSSLPLPVQCAAVQSGFDTHYPGKFQVQPSATTKHGVFAILEVRAPSHNPTWMVELEFVSANASQDPIMDMSFNNLALGVGTGGGVCELRQKYPGHGGGLLGSVLGALTKVGTAIKPDDTYQLRRRRDKTHPDKGFRLLNVNQDCTMVHDASTQIVRNSLVVLDPDWLESLKGVTAYIPVPGSS